MFRAIPGLLISDILAKYQYGTPNIFIIFKRQWNAPVTNANGFWLFLSNDLSAISLYNYFYLLLLLLLVINYDYYYYLLANVLVVIIIIIIIKSLLLLF